MDIKPIKTEADYRAALKEIDHLMDAKPDTPEGDRLDVLTTLAEAWEEKHHQIEDPDPIEAILHRMEALGLARKDLEPMIGTRARVKCPFPTCLLMWSLIVFRLPRSSRHGTRAPLLVSKTISPCSWASRDTGPQAKDNKARLRKMMPTTAHAP